METTLKKLRNRILEVALRDGMGHIPSALSILGIVWELYDKIMTKDDQFILSKGHGCMALYAVLEEKGLLDWSTKLWGHPKRGGAILASTGSLGHGLPMAVGLALAKKIKGEVGKVYCLIGDGECNEGTTWESYNLMKYLRLDNLKVIVDDNGTSLFDQIKFPEFEYRKTIKGDGVPYLQGREWHNKKITKEDYEKCLS